jgi:hypothetical protein
MQKVKKVEEISVENCWIVWATWIGKKKEA